MKMKNEPRASFAGVGGLCAFGAGLLEFRYTLQTDRQTDTLDYQ